MPVYDLEAIEGLLEVLPPPSALTALNACRDFHRLGDDPTQEAYEEFHYRWLADKYRILEWEIFVHDISARNADSPFQCYFASTRKEIQAFLPPQSRAQLVATARAHCVRNYVRGFSRSVDGEIDADLAAFRAIPPSSISGPYPNTHADLFRLLLGSDGNPEAGILLEDGELTLYSLLWVFRHLGRDQISRGVADPEASLSARFVAADEAPAWRDITLPQLLEQLGIVIDTGRASLIPTPRWFSYYEWLRQKASDSSSNLPAKLLADGSAHCRFAQLLQKGFARFREAPPPPPLHVPTSLAAFHEDQLTPLVLDMFAELIPERAIPSGDPPGGGSHTTWRDHDHELFRHARPSFFPWEFLVRTWQPLPVSLLILPIGSSALDEAERRQLFPAPSQPPSSVDAPHALAYATILGQVPAPGSPKFDDWLAAYWSLFNGLASEWLIDQIESDASNVAQAKLADKMKQALKPVLEGSKYIDTLKTAVVKLMSDIDPLQLRTEALDRAAVNANTILFEASHNVVDWLDHTGAIADPDRVVQALSNWRNQLLTILKESIARTATELDASAPLIQDVCNTIDRALNGRTPSDLLGALMLAKAVANRSITCTLLGCGCTPETASAIDSLDSSDLYLSAMVTTAFNLRAAPDDGVSVRVDTANGKHRISLTGVTDWDALKNAVGLKFERNVSPNYSGQRLTSQHVARLMRGWNGMRDVQFAEWINEWVPTDHESVTARLNRKRLLK